MLLLIRNDASLKMLNHAEVCCRDMKTGTPESSNWQEQSLDLGHTGIHWLIRGNEQAKYNTIPHKRGLY